MDLSFVKTRTFWDITWGPPLSSARDSLIGRMPALEHPCEQHPHHRVGNVTGQHGVRSMRNFALTLPLYSMLAIPAIVHSGHSYQIQGNKSIPY